MNTTLASAFRCSSEISTCCGGIGFVCGFSRGRFSDGDCSCPASVAAAASDSSFCAVFDAPPAALFLLPVAAAFAGALALSAMYPARQRSPTAHFLQVHLIHTNTVTVKLLSEIKTRGGGARSGHTRRGRESR